MPLPSEYVPMLWGNDTTNIGSKDWEKWDVKTVLSFNEPDGKVGGGSAVDPKEAARLHHDYLNDLKYDIGAPGTIQGAGSVENPVGDFWFSVSAVSRSGKRSRAFTRYHLSSNGKLNVPNSMAVAVTRLYRFTGMVWMLKLSTGIWSV
jgi:hypothetical protein